MSALRIAPLLNSPPFSGSFSYSINGTNGDFLQSNGDGSNLTGFGPLARITPTGTADASHYLRGDNTWATIAAGNTVVTGTGLVSSGTGTVTFSIDPAQVYYSSGTVTVPSARVTGLAASATTDTTNAGNITSGTLSPTQGGSNTSIGTSPILPNSTFICEGDSITAGSAATPYSSVIGSLPDFAGKNIRILNVAIGATGMVTTVNSGTFTYILNASSGTVTLASGTVDNTFLWKHVTGTSVPTNTYVLARPDSTHLVLNNLPLTTGTQSLGFVGETLTTRYPYTVYPHRPTASGGDGGAASYLNVMVGANDTQTGTNWSSLISAYCTQARSDGFKVLLMTQLPHGGYHNDQNDLRLVINRSEATGTYWDYFLDMDTLFPNPFDTNFFLSDALHLNASAERLWASAIQSAYRSLSAAPAGMRYDLHAPQLVTFSLGSADYQTLCGPTNQRYIVPYSSFVFAQVGVMTAPHNVDLPILFGGLLNGTTVTVLDASGSCNAQHPITVRPTVGSGNTLNAATTNTVILNYPFASKTFLVNGTGYLADSDTTSTAAMTANSTGTITFNTGLRSERIYNTGTTTISTATITLPSPATANQVLEYQGGANITTVTMAGGNSHPQRNRAHHLHRSRLVAVEGIDLRHGCGLLKGSMSKTNLRRRCLARRFMSPPRAGEVADALVVLAALGAIVAAAFFLTQ